VYKKLRAEVADDRIEPGNTVTQGGVGVRWVP